MNIQNRKTKFSSICDTLNYIKTLETYEECNELLEDIEFMLIRVEERLRRYRDFLQCIEEGRVAMEAVPAPRLPRGLDLVRRMREILKQPDKGALRHRNRI